MGRILGLGVHISDKNPWTGEVFHTPEEVENFHMAPAAPEELPMLHTWVKKPWIASRTNKAIKIDDGLYGVPFPTRLRYGRGWRAAGYHYIIERDGNIWENQFRELDGDQFLKGGEIGAHILGKNAELIGICFLAEPGKDGHANLTVPQTNAFRKLARDLAKRYNFSLNDIWGHRTFDEGKTCPNISNEELRKLARSM